MCHEYRKNFLTSWVMHRTSTQRVYVRLIGDTTPIIKYSCCISFLGYSSVYPLYHFPERGNLRHYGWSRLSKLMMFHERFQQCFMVMPLTNIRPWYTSIAKRKLNHECRCVSVREQVSFLVMLDYWTLHRRQDLQMNHSIIHKTSMRSIDLAISIVSPPTHDLTNV